MYTSWTENETAGKLSFTPQQIDITANGNKIFQSGAFALWEFGSNTSLIKGETGLRLDHVYVSGEGFSINTYPTLNPRLSVQWTPLRNINTLDSFTISAGTGLFSQIDKIVLLINKNMHIGNFDIGSDQLFMCVLGANAKLSNNWNFSLEGYYKYYLDRLFIVEDSADSLNINYIPNMGGAGRIFGFETMIQKKGTGIFSGYLSYSFVYARFKNPYNITSSKQKTSNGELLNEWFYPSYHRFHTISLVANWNITQRFSFSLIGSLATGKPVEGTGSITLSEVTTDDGTIIPRYSRSTFYSDTLRSDISCPVDIKLLFKSKSSNKKISWESYIALEDIFASIYSAKNGTSVDPYTGEETANNADINFGIPIPSIGFKMKY